MKVAALLITLALAGCMPCAADPGDSVCAIFGMKGGDVSSAMEITMLKAADHVVWWDEGDESQLWDEGPMLADFLLNPGDRALANGIFIYKGSVYHADKNFCDAAFKSVVRPVFTIEPNP